MSRSCTRAGRTSSRVPSACRWRRSHRRCGTAHADMQPCAAQSPDAPVLTELELARAAQKAVALAQQEKSAWTRADVIKYLGRVLPRSGRDPAAAAVLLEDLADRALRSEFEPVTCLEAPEAGQAPSSLLRADGRSIYQRHGGVRYATARAAGHGRTHARPARANGAPRLTRVHAAHALGADPAQLEDALTGHARDAHDARTRTGLREDQAAAALSVLTYGQRVSVINAPAGSGKTRVLAEAAAPGPPRAGPGDRHHAVPVRPQHLAAGVPGVLHTAQFLGHLPGRRGARGPVPIGPGYPAGDRRGLDDLRPGPGRPDRLRRRPRRQDHPGRRHQPASGRRKRRRHVPARRRPRLRRLAEPVRFRAAWEQEASLRLRDGDTTVLAEYDQHGRMHGGEPEQMMDAAAAAYVALTADGTDTLLMAADHALRRELSRRIRDDLISLGIVQAGPAVRIADGAKASPGDLIICTEGPRRRGGRARPDAGQRRPAPHRNRHPRRPDRAPGPGRDPHSGQRRWTDGHFMFASYDEPNSATRSPTTPPRAAPCTPAWP